MAVRAGLFLLLVAVAPAEVVKNDATPLRNGCSQFDSLVATLPKGALVSIRYAISGESAPCYKVSAQSGDKTFEGFLPGPAIANLEEFEKAVHSAAWLDTPQVMEAVRASIPNAPAADGVAP